MSNNRWSYRTKPLVDMHAIDILAIYLSVGCQENIGKENRKGKLASNR